MNRDTLAHILRQTVTFLEEDAGRILEEADRAEFSARARALHDAAEKPGELLYVGILGGTGVGKSTLINALAQREISSSSDRRPFTDKAVVYRHHKSRPDLSAARGLIREPHAVHESDSARRLILLDLPDFDSAQTENRQTVLEIIPHLDCVVWMVSPEKYGDSALYDLVAKTPMDPSNFTFVVNKGDQLRGERVDDPYGGFKEILGDFAFRLKAEAGVEDPRIFIVSASQEFDGSQRDPWLEKEFRRFRDFLMARRNAKEIASMKTANLIEESRRLLDDLSERARPEEKKRFIDGFKGLERQMNEASAEGPRPEPIGEERAASLVHGLLIAADGSIGPVRSAMKLLGLIRARSRAASPDELERSFTESAERLTSERIRELERRAARLDSELLLHLHGSARADRERDAEQVRADAIQKGFQSFLREIDRRRKGLNRGFARIRRLGQTLTLFAPALILALRLTGLPRVEYWFENPTVGGFLGLAITFVTSIFGPEGLIGLCALLICEGGLLLWLASRRMRKLESTAIALTRDAFERLDELLGSEERALMKERAQTLRRIEQSVDRLQALERRLESETA